MTTATLPDPTAEPTLPVERAAELLGYSRHTAYAAIRDTGALGPVPVLRIGRNYRVPTRPLLRALGVTDA